MADRCDFEPVGPALRDGAHVVHRGLLEIIDDRYDRASTVVTSQIPVELWHARLKSALADVAELRPTMDRG